MALETSGIDASVVQAFDWDQSANKVYNFNWGNNIVRKVCGIDI